MAHKNRKKNKQSRPLGTSLHIPQETKRAIIAVVLIIAGLLLTLAGFGIAGPRGNDIQALFGNLLGVGYFLLPIAFFMLAGTALREESAGFTPVKITSTIFFIVSGLGFIAIISTRGGLLGNLIANPAVNNFGIYAALIVLGGISLISLLVILEGSLSLAPFTALGRALRALWQRLFGKPTAEEALLDSLADTEQEQETEEVYDEDDKEAQTFTPAVANRKLAENESKQKRAADTLKALLGQYTPPPLSLLERDKGRPGVGDIKANANIIKRTLQNFGITIELDEISIGPSVTRYAIKPAEGVRLQKIVALQTNLELALAAHPVRIEAPIPGKSLVGIEVPNSSKVTVGLGTLLESPEFANSSKPLLVAMGRDIAGASIFGNMAKMPHVLIAGATGSGKSVTIHALINSLLYRAGPQQLRFIMIDPKRVELTMYNQLPHLLTPVITDPKKAIMALRWAGKEMERRYNILEAEHVRDIDSYHQNVLTPQLESLRAKGIDSGDPDAVVGAGKIPEAMPYIVVIIDELADIMQTFPRELEASVVRLAQMSRAVGIHLMLSTQRPSVNVITGLIKANIPTRVALQVASQIDSRTILDQGGAEKLLGAGDMLYLAGDMQKPVRLQSAFISEVEVKKVTAFIANNNEAEIPIDIVPANTNGLSGSGAGGSFGSDSFGGDEEIDDDLYESARQTVIETGKASTSYLQRKLGVGYSRAARLMDILEERGVIGPQNGSKPRDVLERGPSASLRPNDEGGVPEEI